MATEKSTAPRRIRAMDELRGLAVFCMVFYHLFYLLYEFFDLAIGNFLFEFFKPAQPLFAGIFILLAGVSCRLSHSNAKRGAKLLLVALGVTLVTAVIMPRIGMGGAEIWFGILHCLSLCMLFFALASPLLNKLNPTAAILLCLALYLLTCRFTKGYLGPGGFLRLDLPAGWYRSDLLAPLGFFTEDFKSADYFPIFPHLFLFLAGSFLGSFSIPDWAYKSRIKPLSFLGRHALLIYILHHPVGFGIMTAAEWVVSLFR